MSLTTPPVLTFEIGQLTRSPRREMKLAEKK